MAQEVRERLSVERAHEVAAKLEQHPGFQRCEVVRIKGRGQVNAVVRKSGLVGSEKGYIIASERGWEKCREDLGIAV